MQKHHEGTPVILRAIDLVIAEVQQPDDSSEREEAHTLLDECAKQSPTSPRSGRVLFRGSRAKEGHE